MDWGSGAWQRTSSACASGYYAVAVLLRVLSLSSGLGLFLSPVKSNDGMRNIVPLCT